MLQAGGTGVQFFLPGEQQLATGGKTTTPLEVELPFHRGLLKTIRRHRCLHCDLLL